jgi:phosphoribosyl-AMP cyclohydrolase
LRSALKEHKAEVLTTLVDRQEQARDRIWRELKASGKLKRFKVVDPDADPVRIVFALRDVGTCDLLVDRGRWDPERFLELLDSRSDRKQ